MKIFSSNNEKNQSKAISFSKLVIFFVFIAYVLYMLSFYFSFPHHPSLSTVKTTLSLPFNSSLNFLLPPVQITKKLTVQNPSSDHQSTLTATASTNMSHIVFGISSSSKFWEKRKEYIKIWYKPQSMRGFVWLDKPVKDDNSTRLLPPLKISEDTQKIPYTHRKGDRSAIRISRIVSETVRLNLTDVRWYVMGDEDTVFIPENLLTVLSKYDHNQPYYIGYVSESHLQNIYFSYTMAFGGGGFAISQPLAESLSKIQDECLTRYPYLYGSDDRIQACMAELGIPLTKHQGFHQFDIYGSALGILASHPITPLVSAHHLDLVDPIFPGLTQVDGLKKLFNGPVFLDPGSTAQQSMCYHKGTGWMVSVSWGFVVQIVRGKMWAREMERPARTFQNWYRKEDYKAFAFNTREVAANACLYPFYYYLSYSKYDDEINSTVTEYVLYNDGNNVRRGCSSEVADPSSLVERVVVVKKPDPHLWDRAPRRNCCRLSPTISNKTLTIDVGMCREGEYTESY